MKSRLLALGLVLLWAAPGAFAQSSDASLASLARQERARQLEVKKAQSVRVWNNDNIPHQPASRNPTAAAGMSPVPVSPEPPPSIAASADSGGEKHDEKYYRDQMKQLQEKLDLHKRQLEVLKQKQGQGQLQYYPDPNKTLQEEYSRSEINKKQGEVAEKEKEIAADEKALEDLRDQLRREGHPAGWLR